MRKRENSTLDGHWSWITNQHAVCVCVVSSTQSCRVEDNIFWFVLLLKFLAVWKASAIYDKMNITHAQALAHNQIFIEHISSTVETQVPIGWFALVGFAIYTRCVADMLKEVSIRRWPGGSKRRTRKINKPIHTFVHPTHSGLYVYMTKVWWCTKPEIPLLTHIAPIERQIYIYMYTFLSRDGERTICVAVLNRRWWQRQQRWIVIQTSSTGQVNFPIYGSCYRLHREFLMALAIFNEGAISFFFLPLW